MSYIYQHVEVLRIIDGDTVRLDIDTGNRTRWIDNFRLNGIDTPERGQDMYREATEHLSKLLMLGVSRAQTHKPDKFGRWLVTIWVPVSGGELCVNDVMVTGGYAVPYFGGTKVQPKE